METRLVAILVGDIVGYSRFADAHENGNVEDLTTTFEIVRECVADHGGRALHSPDRNLLSAFESVVDAVDCALDVLDIFEQMNADASPERRVLMRLGIHLGEVAVNGKSFSGDAVRVAAHLATPERPDGLFVSDSVYQNVASRIDVDVRDMGECQLDGIARPTHAYRMTTAAPKDPVRRLGAIAER